MPARGSRGKVHGGQVDVRAACAVAAWAEASASSWPRGDTVQLKDRQLVRAAPRPSSTSARLLPPGPAPSPGTSPIPGRFETGLNARDPEEKRFVRSL